MKNVKSWFVVGVLATVGLWTAGCDSSGGGGGSSKPAPKPSAGPSDDTPAVDADPGTPAPEAGSSTAPAAGGWGTLKGRFVFDGTAPEPQKLSINKDTEFCSKMPPVDETVVVNAENGGLKNVVLWLYLKRGADEPAIHESYAAELAQPKEMDNLWCRFEPHVGMVRTGQELKIGNKDEVGHNTKADLQANNPFNQTIGVGQDITMTFDKAERLPAAVSCSIHPWMKGYLVVTDTPYAAVTDADGNFEIANLPTGRWTFQVWHEMPGNVATINLKGADVNLDKGRLEFDINEGDNDLGEIKVAAALFAAP
jgi:plastocyanin